MNSKKIITTLLLSVIFIIGIAFTNFSITNVNAQTESEKITNTKLFQGAVKPVKKVDIYSDSGFFNKENPETKKIPQVVTIKSGKGRTGLQGVIKAITDYWKHALGFIAVLMIVIAGFRVTTSSEEDTINTYKQIILWVIIGLIFILSIDTMVTTIFFGGAGDDNTKIVKEFQVKDEKGKIPQVGSPIFQDEKSTVAAAKRGSEEIAGLISWFRMIIGSIAVLMIVLSGIRMVLAFGKEDLIKQEQTVFYWVGFGLIMLALNTVLVEIMYKPTLPKDQQSLLYAAPGSVQQGISEAAGLIQWLLGFVGVIALAAVLYGGFLLVVNWGYEEGAEKAKKIITSAIIGLVIIFSAYAIVATMISASTA